MGNGGNNGGGKNLLIIYSSPNVPLYIEVKTAERNFLHLTGVVLTKNLMDNIQDKNANVAEIFFRRRKTTGFLQMILN